MLLQRTWKVEAEKRPSTANCVKLTPTASAQDRAMQLMAGTLHWYLQYGNAQGGRVCVWGGGGTGVNAHTLGAGDLAGQGKAQKKCAAASRCFRGPCSCPACPATHWKTHSLETSLSMGGPSSSSETAWAGAT